MTTMPRIALAVTAPLLLSMTANAALVSRAGGQAYYDDVLDITWLANANLAASNTFGVTGINPGGSMSWHKANQWIAAMNSANHLGVNTWRLPTVGPLNGSSFNYSQSFNGSTDYGYNQSEQGTAYAGATGSEMAHLSYNTINNKGYCDPLLSTASSCSGPQSGFSNSALPNTGPFSNLQPGIYWSGTTYAPVPDNAWLLDFLFGFQGYWNKANSSYALAVSPGDSAAVPVPGVAWLVAGAFVGIGAATKRRAGNPIT